MKFFFKNVINFFILLICILLIKINFLHVVYNAYLY
jgi:hypothetical protein